MYSILNNPYVSMDDMLDPTKKYILSEDHRLNGMSPETYEEEIQKQFYLNLLNKNPHLESGDPDKAAYDLFYEHEARCKYLNERFPLLLQSNMRSFLHSWKSELRKLLGPVGFVNPTKITSGATTTSKRGNHPVERFHEATITSTLKSYLLTREDTHTYLFPFLEEIPERDYSTMGFVPKTTLISRLICYEQAVNAFYQAGLGAKISRRLVKDGINISKAQDVHKFLAEYSSVTGEYTTDDHSSASHVGSYLALYEFLLPADWFSWCNNTRSSHYWDETLNQKMKFQHFMTNGNGFCFELETAVFYTMIKTCALRLGIDADIYVYGDDMIYPSPLTDLVHKVCHNVGFILNKDKSFSDGLFRESCGADYLNGQNFRPVYVNTPLQTSYELTRFANRIIARYADGMPPNIVQTWANIIRSIPTTERCWGPSWAGDAFLHLPTGAMRKYLRTLSFYDYPNSVEEVERKGRYRTTIRSFVPRARDVTDFGQITNVDGQSEITYRLCVSGYMAGWGGLTYKYKPIRGNPTKVVQATPLLCIIAAEALRTKHIIRNKTGVYLVRTPSYPDFPKSGTRYDYVIENVSSWKYPSLIDESDPLSIFNILLEMKYGHGTTCGISPHLLEGKSMYLSELTKRRYLRQLAVLMRSRVNAMKEAIPEVIINLDIEILDL